MSSRPRLDPEQRLICLGARTTLDAAAADGLRRLAAGPLDWDRVWAEAHVHEVIALLGESLRSLGEPGPAPTAWLERAAKRSRAVLLRNLGLAEELLQVLAALSERGVVGVPVKGVVLAENVYGGLGLRPAADIDVLVRPRDVLEARAAIGSLGYEQSEEPPFEAAHHPFHDAQYFRPTARGEVCLELHSALWNPRFFRPDDGLWARLVPGELRGAPVLLLSPEDTLLHLAVHRTRSPLRLRFLCDVAEAVRRHAAVLDWDALVSRSEALRARTALSVSLRLASDLLGAPVPAACLSRLSLGAVKGRVLERTCGTAALFRAAPEGDLSQQPSLVLRTLEQDGGAHIAWTAASGLSRKVQKRRYAKGLAGTADPG